MVRRVPARQPGSSSQTWILEASRKRSGWRSSVIIRPERRRSRALETARVTQLQRDVRQRRRIPAGRIRIRRITIESPYDDPERTIAARDVPPIRARPDAHARAHEIHGGHLELTRRTHRAEARDIADAI